MSDATASATDILAGKIAYTDEGRVVGTMQTRTSGYVKASYGAVDSDNDVYLVIPADTYYKAGVKIYYPASSISGLSGGDKTTVLANATYTLDPFSGSGKDYTLTATVGGVLVFTKNVWVGAAGDSNCKSYVTLNGTEITNTDNSKVHPCKGTSSKMTDPHRLIEKGCVFTLQAGDTLVIHAESIDSGETKSTSAWYCDNNPNRCGAIFIY